VCGSLLLRDSLHGAAKRAVRLRNCLLGARNCLLGAVRGAAKGSALGPLHGPVKGAGCGSPEGVGKGCLPPLELKVQSYQQIIPTRLTFLFFLVLL
jgi:hypothetical protein